MTVTVSMSAVWLKLVSILCLSCTALSGPEGTGVVWKKVGEAITIQCRPSQGNPEYLSLKKGLSEEVVIYMVKDSDAIVTGFKGRIQQNGAFPNMDFLIRNLTSEDTGPYWCVYKTFDVVSSKLKAEKGNGSVLLVVTEERGASADTSTDCETPHKNLVLVSVVISAAVLLGFIIGTFIWLFKTKTLRISGKPRHTATNDVYEDMRSTLRR
ncbi:uncharacterized protein LOC121199056 [Toxotes jaculatrix]|uniref:uncharacterized protein LOC121199056 n=1 Tax=Toxotes jaculatrix TaxID=941984 RepID=UPI001B3AB6CC|nr:uncharacterized protein LOC121199056 [Toxotes jaculatrix]